MDAGSASTIGTPAAAAWFSDSSCPPGETQFAHVQPSFVKQGFSLTNSFARFRCHAHISQECWSKCAWRSVALQILPKLPSYADWTSSFGIDSAASTEARQKCVSPGGRLEARLLLCAEMQRAWSRCVLTTFPSALACKVITHTCLVCLRNCTTLNLSLRHIYGVLQVWEDYAVVKCGQRTKREMGQHGPAWRRGDKKYFHSR